MADFSRGTRPKFLEQDVHQLARYTATPKRQLVQILDRESGGCV